MNLLVEKKPLKDRQTRELARRWCYLNTGLWPKNTKVPQPNWFSRWDSANPTSRTFRFIIRTMDLIEKAIGREECLREWNGEVSNPKPKDILRPQVSDYR